MDRHPSVGAPKVRVYGNGCSHSSGGRITVGCDGAAGAVQDGALRSQEKPPLFHRLRYQSHIWGPFCADGRDARNTLVVLMGCDGNRWATRRSFLGWCGFLRCGPLTRSAIISCADGRDARATLLAISCADGRDARTTLAANICNGERAPRLFSQKWIALTPWRMSRTVRIGVTENTQLDAMIGTPTARTEPIHEPRTHGCNRVFTSWDSPARMSVSSSWIRSLSRKICNIALPGNMVFAVTVTSS
jgi:hypothetical protein